MYFFFKIVSAFVYYFRTNYSSNTHQLLFNFSLQMMHNLGQGGCQAIEDGFVLTDLLCSISDKSQLKGVLQEYYRKRIVRSAVVQGMSRLSSDIIITSFSTPFKFSGKKLRTKL